MKRWEHQENAVNEINAAINSGEKRIILGSATGTGKSVIMEDLARGWANSGKRVVILTNRRFLFDQLNAGFSRAGLRPRTIASGWEDPGIRPLSLAMFQTLASRNIAPPADRVIFDEAHNESGPGAERMMANYVKSGASIVGITATPLGCSHIYDHLILGADRSDGRDCGALVLAQCFGCGQMDLSGIGRQQSGEYRVGDLSKKVFHSHVYGHVVGEYKKLNPEGRPTILFAPGKNESNGFVDQFEMEGISAASITSDGIYWGGETIPATPDNRQLVKKAVQTGVIKVICNRFILREGIDIPELSHCILATAFGSILSYTQSIGRVLRNHSSLPDINFGEHGVHRGVIIQDHGGNFWRHGSPNGDLENIWRKYFRGEIKCITDDREELMKKAADPEDKSVSESEEIPTECPACGALQFTFRNRRCYRCNVEIFSPGTRRVIQRNGDLVEQHALHDLKQLKRRKKDPAEEIAKAWKRAYFTAKHTGRTFNQARTYLLSGRLKGCEHMRGVDLPFNLPYMPKSREMWSQPVNFISYENLIQERWN